MTPTSRIYCNTSEWTKSLLRDSEAELLQLELNNQILDSQGENGFSIELEKLKNQQLTGKIVGFEVSPDELLPPGRSVKVDIRRRKKKNNRHLRNSKTVKEAAEEGPDSFKTTGQVRRIEGAGKGDEDSWEREVAIDLNRTAPAKISPDSITVIPNIAREVDRIKKKISLILSGFFPDEDDHYYEYEDDEERYLEDDELELFHEERKKSILDQFIEGDFVTEPLSEDSEKIDRLDDAQNKAYGRAMECEEHPILFIHGGPGTGKTTVIAEIIRSYIHQKKKILLASHSNKGAQVPAEKLQQLKNTSAKEMSGKTHVAGMNPTKVPPRLRKSRIMKGQARFPNDEISKIGELSDAQMIVKYFGYEGCNDLEIHKAIKRIGKKAISNKRKELKKEISDNFKTTEVYPRKEKLDNNLNEKGGLVVSTFGNLLNDEMISDIPFDVVIIDEATRMKSSDLILALQKAGKQIIIVGDPLQLGNISISPKEKALIEKSLQNQDNLLSVDDEILDIISQDYDEDVAKKAVKNMERGPFSTAILNSENPEEELPYVFLDINRRSLPKIVKVLSELRYDGKLKAGREPEKGEHEGIIKWYDTKNLDSKERTKGTSKKNSLEAEMICEKVLDLLKDKDNPTPPEDIGIIATYAGQARLIRRHLKKKLYYDKNKPENRKLYEELEPNISSVDAFQGDERKTVLVSLTRSNEDGKLGFLEERERIGVAVGRAQDELYIFGDSSTAVDNNKDTDSREFFSKFKDLVEEHGERNELSKNPIPPKQIKRRNKRKKRKKQKKLLASDFHNQ